MEVRVIHRVLLHAYLHAVRRRATEGGTPLAGLGLCARDFLRTNANLPALPDRGTTDCSCVGGTDLQGRRELRPGTDLHSVPGGAGCRREARDESMAVSGC